MCYSAQIKADYKRFVRECGAIMALRNFARMIEEYLSARDGRGTADRRSASGPYCCG